MIHQETAWYVAPDHRLDFPKLLRAFQQFYIENCEVWLERFQYKEAGPRLLLQAFLQRIINDGGRLNREYGIGRGRPTCSSSASGRGAGVSWSTPADHPRTQGRACVEGEDH